jgi:cell division protein FtsZ
MSRGRGANKKIDEKNTNVHVELSPRIKVVGLGGAGGNATNSMINSNFSNNIEFIAMNTDAQDLRKSKSKIKIQLGEKVTRGLGAGADPEVGKLGAEEERDSIAKALEGADLVFITAGMGGGTGTGSAPVVGKIARDLGALTIAIVTKPFKFEGVKRSQNASAGINQLVQNVDTIIVIPNEKLFELPNKNTTLVNAFEAANNVLKMGIEGISGLVVNQGYINLDFADIKTILSNSGVAMLGFGYAEGENRAKIAAEQAISSPLLERSISGARKILLNITGAENLGLNEASEIADMVSTAAGSEATDLIFGTVIDPNIDKGIKVTIIATDFVDKPDLRAFQQNKGRVEQVDEAAGVIKKNNDNKQKEFLDVPAFLRNNNRK